MIRDCYPSYRSRMERKVIHKDREAERMIKRRHLLSRIAKKTGRNIDWLQLVKELCDDEKQRDMLIELKDVIDTKAGKAVSRRELNAFLDRSDDKAYYTGKVDGLNDAWKVIDKILNPEMY